MKILYISTFYHPSIGGIETFCKELATRMAKMNNEVHIITFTESDTQENIDNRIKIHRVKPLLRWYKARFSPRVKKLISEINPDIIHIQSPAPIIQEFSINDGKRYIATYHNDPENTNNPFYTISRRLYKKFIFPKFCRKVTRIISPSKSFQETSEFLKLIPEAKKGVIPNGVDVDVFSPGNSPKEYYRKLLGLSASNVGIFVASMERWHAYKGVDFLIEALYQLDDVDLQFMFIGDGELRQHYEDKSAELIQKGRVKFFGKVDQNTLVQCYRAADFLVLPSISRMECFGIVLIEAMGCGLPVITTNIPGPSDVVEVGLNGFKVEPKDPSALSKTIRLILNEEQLRYMSSLSRKLAIEKYRWENVANAYLNEYNLLLSKN